MSDLIFFVSTKGKDTWSGLLPEPSADGTDGPVASIYRARNLVKVYHEKGDLTGPALVRIRGGRYFLDEPVFFRPESSYPTTYEAFPGETPILDAGVPVTGWSENVVDGKTVWTADASALITRHGYFKSLFINGHRCARTRLPKKGYYHLEDVPTEYVKHVDKLHNGGFDGTFHFRYQEGTLTSSWKNLTDVYVVPMHIWLEERMPIEWVDESTRIVKSTRKSVVRLDKNTRYFVENVAEALTEPGEWYLDRSSGAISYLPLPGESLDSIQAFAGVLCQFIKVYGRPEENQPISSLVFRGLTFEHADWEIPRGFGKVWDPDVPAAEQKPHDLYEHPLRFAEPDVDYAGSLQAAYRTPGALFFEGAHDCRIENCTIRHIGWYGIELTDGCRNMRITANEFTDCGAGGIKVNGVSNKGDYRRRTGNSRVTDNHIHDTGLIFPGSIGIALLNTFDNQVLHNHIHDMFYSAVSVGWVWGFDDSVARGNRIEKNRIHDLGKGVLSDMGGIYMLGISPGTVVRNNIIYNVEKSEYGGWGIYCDEGSSHIVIEDNICYNVNSQPYHLHFGRENTLRNNIFAFGREGQIAVSRGRDFVWIDKKFHGRETVHCACTLTNNIFISNGAPMYACGLNGPDGDLETHSIRSDLNLFWDLSGKDPVSVNHRLNAPEVLRTFSLRQMQEIGFDLHSIVADPKCKDALAGDFTLSEDSPAFALGFTKIDVSEVGPRCPALL